MIRLLLFLLPVLTGCTSYTTDDLIGSWRTENENGNPVAIQFSDSLALIYDGGANEIFIYAYTVQGTTIDMEFRDGFIPNTESYSMHILDKDGPAMTVKFSDDSRLNFKKFSGSKPEIHPGQLLYYENMYREQLSEIPVPPRDPPDFNEMIGFDCGLAGELTGPAVVVRGLIRDQKYNGLEDLVRKGNPAESVLASFALLALEERGVWDIGDARDKIMDWKTSERKIQTCITDSTWDFYPANRLFEDSNPFGSRIRAWLAKEITS